MTYNITLTNGNAYATVNDGTIVTNTSTITLVGKNYAGYGAVLDENFVHLMENSANGTAPTGAVTGQLWYDTTNSLLKQYNGSMFRAITAVTSSNAAPSLTAGYSAVSGDLWYDTVNAQLNVYTGNAWLVTGPAFTSSQGTSGAIVKTVNDIFLQPHTIVEMYTGGNIVGIISQDSTFTPQTAIPGFPTVSPGVQLANSVNGVVPGFTATGNITTAGNLVTTGNVYANNYIGTGFISTAGNIYGGNIIGNIGGPTTNIVGNSVSVSGNITAANFNGGNMRGANVNFDSVGVGTAPTGVLGELIAINNITAYYSDDRLKTRLGPIIGALERVQEIEGFYYQANQTAVDLGYEVKREVGLSAQQVQKVLPEVIAPAPIDNQYLTIRYEKVVPLLVEAIKELAAEVEELKKNK